MPLRVRLSRLINYRLLGGRRNQMLCTRLYVSHCLWGIWIMDHIFFWESQHCYKSFCYDVEHGGFND